MAFRSGIGHGLFLGQYSSGAGCQARDMAWHGGDVVVVRYLSGRDDTTGLHRHLYLEQSVQAPRPPGSRHPVLSWCQNAPGRNQSKGRADNTQPETAEHINPLLSHQHGCTGCGHIIRLSSANRHKGCIGRSSHHWTVCHDIQHSRLGNRNLHWPSHQLPQRSIGRHYTYLHRN